MKTLRALLFALCSLLPAFGDNFTDRRPPLACALVSFDGNSAVDRSFHAHTITATGSPSFSQRTFVLDGTDDWLSIPDHSDQRAYPLTISCWFNMGGNDQAQYASLIDKYSTGSANGWQVWADTSEAIHAWYFGGSGSNCIYGGGDGLLFTPSSYKSAGWTHLVVTFSSTGGEIYINGTSVDTQAWTGTPTASTTTHRLGIGQHNFSGGRYFKGSIDEVKIFPALLTAAEIRALYASEQGLTRP